MSCAVAGCDGGGSPDRASAPDGAREQGSGTRAADAAGQSSAVAAADWTASAAISANSACDELEAAPFRGVSADGTYEVRWSPVGGAFPDAEPFAVLLCVRRKDGAPLATDAVVRVDAEMPHHGHGMNLVPIVSREGGSEGEDAVGFRAEGMLFHMAGRWVVAVDIEEAGVLERAQWFVDVE
jgi:hypothetical protein